MKKYSRYAIVLLCMAALAVIGSLISCRIVALNETTSPPLEQLKIGSTDISNWTPDGDIKVYIGTELFDLINGGAPKYLDKGCLKTGRQRFMSANGGDVVATVYDFGTDINAMAMFSEVRLQNAATSVKDPQYSDTVVSLVPLLGGVDGCAHFLNYYIELSVTGFSDQVLAIKTFDLFLGLYEKKIRM